MSNRGPARGVLEPYDVPARLHSPPRPPQPAPRSDRVTVPIVTSTLPIRPERVPHGVPLDALDDAERPAARAEPGWRVLFSRATGIRLGPGKARSYELLLHNRIRAAAGRMFSIAVFNLKADVGTTTVVEALGSTFAAVRDDRVVAVDAAAGDLADRHGRRTPLGIFDLVADGPVTQYLDVRAHTFMNESGLEVLAGNDMHRNRRVHRDDYAAAFAALRDHYSVLLTDCGKTLGSGVVQSALRRSQAAVVVTSADADAIRRTRTTLEWLRHNGYHNLLESMVLAVNHTRRGKPDNAVRRELEKISWHFPATPVIVLPFDEHLSQRRGIVLERLSKKSRRRYLEMAAALADRYPRAAQR